MEKIVGKLYIGTLCVLVKWNLIQQDNASWIKKSELPSVCLEASGDTETINDTQDGAQREQGNRFFQVSERILGMGKYTAWI